MSTRKQQRKRQTRPRKAGSGVADTPQRGADRAADKGKTADEGGAPEAVPDEVMVASEDSFPASDAPAWIPVRA